VITFALDRDFYTDTLDQPAVYKALSAGPFIDQVLITQLRLPPDADTTALKNIFESVLTTDYMKEQVSAYLNELFDYLQGKTESFTPVIDLKPIKAVIAGDQQDAFLAALLQALPECAPGQTPGFGSENESACKPAGVLDEWIIEIALKPALPTILARLPDEMPIQGEAIATHDNMRWRSAAPGMATPASILLSVLVLAFIAVVVWYVTALIADAGWHGRLQWLGWTLLIPSLLVFLMSFAGLGGISAYWIRFGLERAQMGATPFGPGLVDPLQMVAAAALPRIANAFKMVGGIGGAFGLVFIFWGIATPRRKIEKTA
jgi:hypothetical protein